MCVVSFIGNHYQDKYRRLYPDQPWQHPQVPLAYPPTNPVQAVPSDWGMPQKYTPGQIGYIEPPVGPSQQEFDQLKKDVEEMKILLAGAKAYDEANNEPNCEIEEKMDFLRMVAKFVGVDLEDVIGK